MNIQIDNGQNYRILRLRGQPKCKMCSTNDKHNIWPHISGGTLECECWSVWKNLAGVVVVGVLASRCVRLTLRTIVCDNWQLLLRQLLLINSRDGNLKNLCAFKFIMNSLQCRKLLLLLLLCILAIESQNRTIRLLCNKE